MCVYVEVRSCEIVQYSVETVPYSDLMAENLHLIYNVYV